MSQFDEERIAKLTPFFRDLTAFSGLLQDEIVEALLDRPGVKEDLRVQSKKPGAQTMERLNAAIFGLIGAMPLAHINDINLVMNAFKMHSTLTDDPIIEEIMRRLKIEREGEPPTLN